MTRVLLITMSAVGDTSSGGAIRSNMLRDALRRVADVDTIVLRFEPHSVSSEWRQDRTRDLRVAGSGAAGGLRARLAARGVIGRIARAGNYDLIIARSLGPMLLVPRRLHDRLIVDGDDLIKAPDRGSALSRGARLRHLLRNAVAPHLARRAAHLWVVNPLELSVAPAGRSSLLPNVLPSPDPARARSMAEPDRLLMVGFFDYAPNIEGLRWFATAVLPALVGRFPRLSLHAIGRDSMGALSGLHPAIVARGFVDDLTHEYDRASLVIAPIRSGGGTQMKVIDALLHGRPLVASAFAHKGFAHDLTPDTDLLVADDPAEWVELCARALDDRNAAEIMAASGEVAVRARVGPDAFFAAVAQTLAQLRSR